jgi:hypothetical protein
MRISSLFQPHKLSPVWKYSPSGKIWKILFADSELLLGEARDMEAKRASFFCIDSATGNALWSELRFSEPWWVGIDGVHRDLVFFHEFAKPDLPEHKCIRAVDLRSGRILWSNEEASFFFAYADFVYAERKMFEKRVALKLSLATGETLEEIDDPDALLALRRLSLQESAVSEDVLYPELVDNVEGLSKIGLLRSHIGTVDWRSLESIETSTHVVASFHSVSKPSLTESPLFSNQLFILEKASAKKVFADTLNAETKAIVPDSFFMRNQTVYYVKEYSSLVAVKLN